MLYSRWRRLSEIDIFAKMIADLSSERGEKTTVMIDAIDLKALKMSNSMAVRPQRGGRSRFIVRTKGNMNSKLCTIYDSNG